jgi:hypothetical protein
VPNQHRKLAPTDLDFEKALMYFHAYMYGPLQGKLRLHNARGVQPAGKAMSSDWEVFASILVKDVGKKLGKGVDLSDHEVKSAENGGSYEYQYHKLGGRQKLQDDAKVAHLFFAHSDNLRKVELRYVDGRRLNEKCLSKWLEEFPVPYEQQRFRRSVAFGWVEKNGELLMRLENGEVTYPEITNAPISEAAAGLRPDKG